MKTRMEKYYDEENVNTLLREHKNESLYQNIGDLEVPDYKLETNVTVLDNNAKNIDVEKIKKILDTKYNKEPKRRSIVIEDNDTPDANINLDETREYDINAILEQARSEKEVDYEKERVKKLRDTQYDILSSLDIANDKEKDEPQTVDAPKRDDDELINLINTITMRELGSKTESEGELDPLDILTDLKGSENTVVIGGAAESESIGETSPIMSLAEADAIKPKLEEEARQKDINNTLAFTQSDFDDFDDLKREMKSNKALVYVAIILVSLVLIAGLVIFLNKFLDMGLF